jgi:hypothetical protein
MKRLSTYLAIGLLVLSTSASAANLVFANDPFAGCVECPDAGRTIFGDQSQNLTFDVASDVIMIDLDVFGLSGLSFFNGLSSNLPSSGVNFIVLNDGPPLAAGTAANAIADRITESTPGFFIYFNTGLDLPRLVYSADLSEATADLSILARLTNLAGPEGFNQLPDIGEDNVGAVPEPSSLLLASGGAVALGLRAWRRRRVEN